MKQIDVKLKLFIVLFLTAIGPQAMAQTSTYTLTANGIGPVQLGMKAVELPESVPGLYDSKLSDVYIDEEMPDDEDMPEFATWYFYDEEGETVFTAIQDSLGYISEITISSPNILTAEGLHVGSLPQQVETVKGAQKILPDPMADYGRVSYQLNGITLWIDDYLIDDDHSEERVAAIDISDPVLTAEGIGPVRLGTKATDLPESAPRLYASRVQGPVGTDWHFLDEQGNELFTAKQDKDGAISEITVTSPSINATLGMHVGMPLQQVEYISGLQLDKPDQTKDSISCYDVYDITLNVNKPDNQNIDKDSSLVASMTVPGLLDIIAQNVADTHNRILKFFTQSNSLDELNQHMDEIRQMPQVEEVHSNFETTMFVQFKDLGTFSYSFFPEEPEIQGIDKSRPLKFDWNSDKNVHNLNNMVIANQHKNDYGHKYKNETIIPETKNLFEKSPISIQEMDPTLNFFLKDIFNFDIVFLLTHGTYDSKSDLHWLMTSEVINDKNLITKEDIKDGIVYTQQFFKQTTESGSVEHEIDNTQLIIIDTHKEKRLDRMETRLNDNKEEIQVPIVHEVPITYLGISEEFIKTAFGRKNSFAIMVNTACHSLEDKDKDNINDNLAKAFQRNRQFVYIGHTANNGLSAQAGLDYFSGILSGLSLKQAFNCICEELKKENEGKLEILFSDEDLKQDYIMKPWVGASIGSDNEKIFLAITGHAFLKYHWCKYDPKTREFNTYDVHYNELRFLPEEVPMRYGFEISRTEHFLENETRSILYDELSKMDVLKQSLWGDFMFSKHLTFPKTETYYDKKNNRIYIRAFIYHKEDTNTRNYSDTVFVEIE